MFFAPEATTPIPPARSVPPDFWRRLCNLDAAFQLELFRMINHRLPGEPEQWGVVLRHRESGAEQFSVSSDTIPFVLALAVLQAERQGLMRREGPADVAARSSPDDPARPTRIEGSGGTAR